MITFASKKSLAATKYSFTTIYFIAHVFRLRNNLDYVGLGVNSNCTCVRGRSLTTYLHCESKKARQYTLVHIFAKY